MEVQDLDRLLSLINEGHQVTITIKPSKNIIDGHEAEQLLGVTRQTLKEYRDNHWIEGAHYFPQPNGRPKYNRHLIVDWQKHNVCDPQKHNSEIQKYLRSN